MTRSARPPFPALALACGVLLAGVPAALAQQSPTAPEGAASPGAAAGRGPIQDGLRVPIPREQTQQRLREAGIAPPRDHVADQLEDLNALSRQLAPSVPVPAPEIDARR